MFACRRSAPFSPLGALPGALVAAPLACGGGIGHGRARPVQHITKTRCVSLSLSVCVCVCVCRCVMRLLFACCDLSLSLSLALSLSLSLSLPLSLSLSPCPCPSDPVTPLRGPFLPLPDDLASLSNATNASAALVYIIREYKNTCWSLRLLRGHAGPGRLLASATSLYRSDHVFIVVQPGVLLLCLTASMFLALSAGRGICVAWLEGRGP